jgi:hypothetical protein
VTGQSRKEVTLLPRQVRSILRSKRRQTTRACTKGANGGTLGPGRTTALQRGDGSANQHGPAFHLDQTWQIHTSPTACLQAISEIREPQRQHPQGKDKAQTGFCPVSAIPPLHLSDVDIRLSRSTACDRCRVLPELAFGCPGARSLADCRTAQTRRGHCTAE